MSPSATITAIMASVENLSLCLASPTFYPTHGGAQLRFLRYLPGLLERGIQPRVFTGTPPLRRLDESDRQSDWYTLPVGSWLPGERVHGTPVHRLRLPEHSDWQRSLAYYRGLYRICRQTSPRVLQLIPPLDGGAIPWLMALRRLGICLVFAHTLPHRVAAQPLKRHWQQRIRRSIYQRMDHVVSNSPDGDAQLRDLGVRTPCTVIPNGVDLVRFQPPQAGERARLRQHLALPLEHPVVITVGAVSARKGTDLMVAAWMRLAARYPQAQLVIIGPRREPNGGDREFQTRLDGLLAASPSRVRFMGRRDDVADFLRAADVFLFASLKEGMPNAVLEAMASALPVVTTPFMGLGAHFGRAGREYLLAEHDELALAAMLSRCLGDAALAATLGEAARAWVSAQLSLDACVDRYAGLYRSLVA